MAYQLLQAKAESVSGTAETLAAIDSILCENIQFRPLGTRVVLNTAKPSTAANAGVMYGEHAEVSFDIIIAGSGTVATAPKWGPLMKSAGADETVVAATSVTYAPRTADPDTAPTMTIQFRHFKRLHKMIGCRGKYDIKLVAGQPPRLTFLYRGILIPVAAAAVPANADANFTGWPTSKPIAQGRSTFSLGGVNMVLRDLSVTGGDTVKFIDLPSQKGVFLRGERALTGSIKANTPEVATYNLETKWLAGDREVFAFTHNTVAGSIVTVNGRAQLDTPAFTAEDGFDVFTSGCFLVGSDDASSNDHSIVLT